MPHHGRSRRASCFNGDSMAKKWKPGDKVTLASGGPDMTVRVQYGAKDGEQIVICQWFDKNDNAQKAEFAPDGLVAVSDKT
jgi:uncharacterized protein YodC (DUF2158 family)